MSKGRFHIIIDLNEVNLDKLIDKDGLNKFLLELPPLIGMKVLSGPVVVEGVKENPGITGFVIIDYSHISIHTFTNSLQALVDIFSCKPFDQNTAKKAVFDYFQVKDLQAEVQLVSWK